MIFSQSGLSLKRPAVQLFPWLDLWVRTNNQHAPY